MNTIISAVSVLAYLFVGGMVGARTYRYNVSRCKKCARVERGEQFASCYDMHPMPAAIAGVAWPLALPMFGGFWLSEWLTTGEQRAEAKATRDEKQHRRRMEQLGAERALAAEHRRKTLADIQFLVENGIHADVPGLYETEDGVR